MKRILMVLLVILMLTSCAHNPVTEEPVNPENNEEISFPQNFKLGNTEVSFIDVSETKNLEFNDGGTKVKLSNSDGKYFTVNYSVKNNELFDIDIDHSIEVVIEYADDGIALGEYYENKTGKENTVIKPGETKDIIFVSDVDLATEYKKIKFMYKGNKYEYTKK